ncbi:hypothetical protein LJR225_000473 [Phenylobacterium sp. LjRoot225]|uniref:sucrase ferredoxin n=1 Tax=Phenylobacterium sp. LjRoot225 TaxID=3342285 RepID=UPI003ED07F3C
MEFCSRVSLAAHEAFAGTGVRGETYVFLPVPKKVWHDAEMNAHWASREELLAIRAARGAGVVARLYNPPDDDAPVLVHMRGDHPAEGLATLLAMFGRRWRIDATGAPRLAICTHGTRDRCCAKFGFAAFQAARRLFESGESVFAPIESSHLGGDRFAATGIFFPSGSMYAHLDEAGLGALCVAEAEGRLDPARYRGGVFDPQLTQLVRAGLARQGLVNDSVAPIAVTQQSPSEIEASVAGRHYRVTLKSAEVEFYGSCSALSAAKPSRGRRMVFERAERMETPA